MSPQNGDRPDPVDISVGARIRLVRKMRGRSQQGLAEAIGVTFQQVQKYESGANRVSASMLTRIAVDLGVPITEFFGPVEAASQIGDDLTAMLGEPGALRLLRGYCQLPHRHKAALVSFIEALSGLSGRALQRRGARRPHPVCIRLSAHRAS